MDLSDLSEINAGFLELGGTIKRREVEGRGQQVDGIRSIEFAWNRNYDELSSKHILRLSEPCLKMRANANGGSGKLCLPKNNGSKWDDLPEAPISQLLSPCANIHHGQVQYS